ncbi:SPOR domain-containing protein [Glaciimonas soli]|uniref:SPOR domain-containing protein n=1 Tax=Glaciimonas soli TaxID=2590999 RepID=A0A843YTA2_9BURK|nr:SPOR domain-containing protein [Glaciimonas soli]MQR00934.1 SPOR domain-containing protein [Glaciimonas soli]
MRKQNHSKNHSKNQAGGTMLGLIIGLIIGLAIAVVVAILITKTPSPFNNKNIKADKSADVVATPEQLSDPNKPLYGNRGTITPAPSITTPTPETPVAAPKSTEEPDLIGEKIQEMQKEAKVPAVSKSTSDKVAAEKAKKAAADSASNSTGTKTDTADAGGNWIYYLQVGAFREQAEAENARARLALMGFEATISERPSDEGSLYRVRIGSFSSLETMNRMRSKLSDNGINAAVVRSAK